MFESSSVAYPGFQREGCLRSGPIQKVGGGGGGPGPLQVRYTKSGGGGGGGGGASGPIYEKWGGGGHSASGPIPLGTQKISTCTYLR